LTAPLVVLTVGLFTFALNAGAVWLMSEVVDGLDVSSVWAALAVVFALAVVNVSVGGLLHIDDDLVWRQHVVRRLVRRTDTVERTDVPGFLFVQIDGLGHDVLAEAMATGHAPFLARLVEHGTHRLLGYECDLSSQTGAMQAGILLGNNHDMPAFRWYEKSTGALLVSNRAADAAQIEARQSTGTGLLADGHRGASAVYVDPVGYDEVAHHSGIVIPDALDTLARIDRQLERLLSTVADAPRPYFVVPMSDHGQTQGSTFLQRYGESLGDLTRRLAAHADVAVPEPVEEGWHNVNGMLTDAANDDSTLGRLVERTTRSRTEDGEVALGPATDRSVAGDGSDIVVLASGNLGLLSFPAIDGRASRQELDRHYPGLVDGLRSHEGIGFVLVRDEDLGDIALGRDGVHHLVDGRVEGLDPLLPFGPRTAQHLRRTSSFANCPDLLVNSFYDPVADEGAAFEELIGFHGGLGGKQSRPFILAPAQLPVPAEPIVGAEAVHHLLKSWIASVQGGRLGTTADA